MKYEERQLTQEPFGHCLNSTQCISPDGRYIVYDTRNDDGALAANGEIRVLDIDTGEDIVIYKTKNQTEYGPGVGAATWSPDGKMLLFLGGIQNANSENPYSFTRRTGIGIEWGKPNEPIWMDARDMNTPSTPGALRGGTHAHTWSGQDNWISFTYNDHLVAEAAKSDNSLADLRTVGLMFPGEVNVSGADGIENKNGSMYSVLLVPVVKNPRPGTNEVAKAFDECWIGENGYVKNDGSRQRKAIAWQGHVVDDNGKTITEIFVSDLPDHLIDWVKENPASGTATKMPKSPSIIQHRRISFMENGVSATPRHWLRCTPDGSVIGFFREDENKIVQLWGISPNGGDPWQISHLPVSASGPFNFSFDGKYAAMQADERVWVVNIATGETTALTSKDASLGRLNGAVLWSPTKYTLYYNRYVAQSQGRFLQVFSLAL